MCVIPKARRAVSGNAANSGVLKRPGAMVTTRILCCANYTIILIIIIVVCLFIKRTSLAIGNVSATTPPFEEA
jgi:hypothetical protein